MLSKVVSERVVTSLGISVGTGLALETLFESDPFDKNRKAPPKQKPGDFDIHIFNIFTLFRNVINSISHKDQDALVRDVNVKDQLLNDIYLINELYRSVDTVLMFYLPDYTNVYKLFNKYKDTKIYRSYITYQFMRQNISKLRYPATVHTGKLEAVLKPTTKGLILTHFTVDLLQHETSPKLCLLESHTGKIKSRTEWGNKYHPIGKRDMSVLPINSKLLYALGDKTLVIPPSLQDRRAVYELAMVNHWTPATTKMSVDRIIRRYNNKIPV